MKESCRHPHVARPIQRPLSELTAQLRQHARKITGPRQAILEVLRRHPHPLTSRELREALPDQGCDLATIYRSLHLLEEMGLVKRFDFGDGAARFELIEVGDDGHHHHLICRDCGTVVEIDECISPELERALEARHGFADVSHKLEFFGVCPRCRRT
jgi:Fur family ferric uptake transcriptional regulator